MKGSARGGREGFRGRLPFRSPSTFQLGTVPNQPFPPGTAHRGPGQFSPRMGTPLVAQEPGTSSAAGRGDLEDGDHFAADTHYEFEKDQVNLLTHYRPQTVARSSPFKIFIRGILKIEYRLVEDTVENIASTDARLASVSSPLKSGRGSLPASVAIVASFSCKTAGETKSCMFVVPYDQRQNKSAYQKPKLLSGDDTVTVAFHNKSLDLWTQFINDEIENFEMLARGNSRLVLRHWNRVGLQRSNSDQTKEVFIWNKAVAHICRDPAAGFITVTLMEAGYFPLSTETLKEVTVCRNPPSNGIALTLQASLGDVAFITFLAIAGQCVLACRPRYVHDILQRKLPTTLLVGKPDCGKSYLMELALLVVGTDRIDGRAFSYSHITAHEFGKRALRSTVPMLVNDPRTESAKDYALLIQQVSEGDTHQTNALTYNPGAGPLLSTNGDFMHALKRMNKDAWERIKSRLVVLQILDPMNFPVLEGRNLYSEAHALSAYLPALLLFPTEVLKTSIEWFIDELNIRISGRISLSDARRNVGSLALFYAFGEMVGSVLTPAFNYRTAVIQHMDAVSIPSLLYCFVDGESRSDTPIPPISIEDLLLDMVEYALNNPNVEWYKWVQWSLVQDSKRAIAIRSTCAFGEFGKHAGTFRDILAGAPQRGCITKANFRQPKASARAQQAQKSHVFYVTGMNVNIQHQLTILDTVAKESDYCAGWKDIAQQCFHLVASHNYETVMTAAVVKESSESVRRYFGVPSDAGAVADKAGGKDSDHPPSPDAVTVLSFDSYFSNSGRTQAVRKLAEIGLDNPSDDTLRAVAEEYWRKISVTSARDWESQPSVLFSETAGPKDSASVVADVSCSTTVVAEPSGGTSVLAEPGGSSLVVTVMDSDQHRESPDMMDIVRGSECSKSEKESKSATRAQPKRSRKKSTVAPKKRFTFRCGLCNSDAGATKAIPCSLFEMCKKWICKPCCVRERSEGWYVARQTSVDYNEPTSLGYIICASH